MQSRLVAFGKMSAGGGMRGVGGVRNRVRVRVRLRLKLGLGLGSGSGPGLGVRG